MKKDDKINILKKLNFSEDEINICLVENYDVLNESISKNIKYLESKSQDCSQLYKKLWHIKMYDKFTNSKKIKSIEINCGNFILNNKYVICTNKRWRNLHQPIWYYWTDLDLLVEKYIQ